MILEMSKSSAHHGVMGKKKKKGREGFDGGGDLFIRDTNNSKLAQSASQDDPDESVLRNKSPLNVCSVSLTPRIL